MWFVRLRLRAVRHGYPTAMGLFHHTEPDEPLVPPTREEALADHAMGIELQLLEIAVRRDRALAQRDRMALRRLDAEAAALQSELGEVGLRLGA